MSNDIKILIITSGNYSLSPYIHEQVENLLKIGGCIEYFFIKGHNIIGYLQNIRALKNKIKSYGPDIVHAHYGLSGLLALLTFAKPIIVTYHGSDVNDIRHKYFSKIISKFSEYNIFVEESLGTKLSAKMNSSVIPCGVNLDDFYPINKFLARERLGIDKKKKIVLFSSSFDRAVKNSKLAKAAIHLAGSDIELIELKGYTRKEVMLLINSADVCLLTSYSEGSPQFIKEVMACNAPAVSTDVGDVKYLFNSIEGYFLSDYRPELVSNAIMKAMNFRNKSEFTTGRERLVKLGLDNVSIAKSVYKIYNLVLKKESNPVSNEVPDKLTIL